jgi:hypothetical protein
MATFKRPSEYGNGAPAEPQTSSAWAEFLRSLEAKLAATKANLGQLESERAEQSLAAELGDQNALLLTACMPPGAGGAQEENRLFGGQHGAVPKP